MTVLWFNSTITSTTPTMSFLNSPRKSSLKSNTWELKKSTSILKEKNSKRSMMNEQALR
jgi:hypothetical protein